jgi:hypothetical protein
MEDIVPKFEDRSSLDLEIPNIPSDLAEFHNVPPSMDNLEIKEIPPPLNI